MNENHITDMLDNSPLATMSEIELQEIRAHVSECNDCARAFAAAELSARLVEIRADETAQSGSEVNPFFQTRVLAAWREQQNVASVWSLRRLWNTTNALIASMAVTTAALAVLTFVLPANDPINESAVTHSASAEAVMFDEAYDDVTNEQVLSAIYGEEDEGE